MSKLLVLAETNGQHGMADTLSAIACAQTFCKVTGGDFDLLIMGGPEIADIIEPWRGYGAGRVYMAAMPELAHATAERVAAVCLRAVQQSGAAWVVAGAASQIIRDALPRVAALLDLPMLSGILSVDNGEGGLVFRRERYAGQIITTVQITGDGGVFNVGQRAFGNPEQLKKQSAVEALVIDPASLPNGTTRLGLDLGPQARPELTNARTVVIGGRALGDAAAFERLIGGLADKLGAAVGASGGAVSSGIAPSELLIGQTGKTIKPDLCIVAGVSGVDQHIAGITKAKVIVAINSDPTAPIFQIADYGLVADLRQALPELIEKLP